jgi:D-aminopeptidase
MRSFELHAGIGSASRSVQVGPKSYTIGVLVNTNHGRLNELSPLLRSVLETYWKKSLSRVKELNDEDQARLKREPHRQGSIIIIIATDLPLDTHALQQLAQHAGLGVAQAGGSMATTSGDFALAFNTANPVLMDEGTDLRSATYIKNDHLTPIFQATIEAVVKAQLTRWPQVIVFNPEKSASGYVTAFRSQCDPGPRSR